MADVRLSARDLRQMDQLQKRMQQTVRTLDARAVEKLTLDVTNRIDSIAKRILADVEKVQDRLGITDPRSKHTFRWGVETVEGATSAAKELAPWLMLMPPQARLAALGGAAAVGAIEGAGREETRRRMADALSALDRQELELEFKMRERLLDFERREAAYRRAARLR